MNNIVTQKNTENPEEIFIVAGEASGDLHGAKLVKAIKKLSPSIKITGIGGDKMAEAGVNLLIHSGDMAVMGLLEVITCLGKIMHAMKVASQYLRDNRPSLLILIDYPGFNFILANRAKKLGIPIFYYICPQVWAWRQKRVKKMEQFIDKAAVILPFEEAFLRSHNIDAEFVGNPLTESVKTDSNPQKSLQAAGIDTNKPILGLLPGSRHGEVNRLFPRLAKATKLILKENPNIQPVVGLAPSITRDQIAEMAESIGILDKLQFFKGNIYNLMSCSRLILIASGTATLEAALTNTPMIVVYALNEISYLIGKPLIKVKYASLVNLIEDKMVVPELLQHDATPEKIAAMALKLLNDPDQLAQIKNDLSKIRKKLGENRASERAASLALTLINQKSNP